jgi:hypothetical protein
VSCRSPERRGETVAAPGDKLKSTMSLAILIAAADRVITYVRVERPQLDIVQLILGSFTLTGLLVLLALLLGATFGVTLILKRRREPPAPTGLDLSGP